MIESTEKFVGHGFWDGHECSFLLVELNMSVLRGYVEAAKKMFEEHLGLFCVEFRAPNPVEIEPADETMEMDSYQLIPYYGFEYTEIYDHKPRYSKYRIYLHGSVSYVTYPKHWDAMISLDLGEVLN